MNLRSTNAKSRSTIKKDWAAILIKKNKHKEFVYEININMDDGKLLASKSVYLPNDKGKLKLGVEGKIRANANSMQIARITKEDIIAGLFRGL